MASFHFPEKRRVAQSSFDPALLGSPVPQKLMVEAKRLLLRNQSASIVCHWVNHIRNCVQSPDCSISTTISRAVNPRVSRWAATTICRILSVLKKAKREVNKEELLLFPDAHIY